MKPLEFHHNQKTYRLKPAALAVFIILILVIVIAVLLVIASHIPAEEKTDPLAVSSHDAAKASAPSSADADGSVLAETDDAGEEYIDTTLFIGDSNTARFLTIMDEDNNAFTSIDNTIGVVGMGIDAISSLPVLDTSSGRLTIPQAVEALQPQRVIITFGTNNLDGGNLEADEFIERYEKQLQNIVDAYPSVDLIVNSIPPVSQSTIYRNATMKQIDAWNDAIEEMCRDNGWKYLNSAEQLKGSDGYAKSGYMESYDGLHFSEKGLEALFTYIRTHAYITEDDRPKPLKSIPEVAGVPSGLIQTNPLDGEEFTEDPALIDSNLQQSCLAAYGVFDSETNTCSWPTPTPTAAMEVQQEDKHEETVNTQPTQTTATTSSPSTPPPTAASSSAPADSTQTAESAETSAPAESEPAQQESPSTDAVQTEEDGESVTG